MISDLTLCEGMLDRFLGKTGKDFPSRRLQVAVAVPGELTEVERLAVIESLRNVRAADVLPVNQVLAAGQGAGLAIEEARGHMVVDIGAGVTDIAVISLANTILGRTIPVAGDEMDAAIAASCGESTSFWSVRAPLSGSRSRLARHYRGPRPGV
jgi:rod shape-determining protein MreB